jgi:hypothetical protein
VPLTLTIPVTDRAFLTPYVRRAFEVARDVADAVHVAPAGNGVHIVGTVGEVTRGAMLPFLELSTRLNEELLRRRELPPLYGAGVRYQVEPPGREDWDPGDIVRARGWGDCEDLAGWRAAELRGAGELDARADTYVSRERPDGSRVWHAIVVRGDGTLEDPSAHLGMRVRRGHIGDGTRFRHVLSTMAGGSSRAHWAPFR